VSEPSDIVHCEVCDLAHERKAERCDRCEHRLGTLPDWTALRGELPQLRKKMALGFIALVGMIALNLLLFGSAGVILLVPPIGWILFSAIRHKVLKDQLRRAPAV
jgi:hypothetical protein